MRLFGLESQGKDQAPFEPLRVAQRRLPQSLDPGSFVSGIPARSHKDRIRQDVVVNQLPDILNRIRKIEKELPISEDN